MSDSEVETADSGALSGPPIGPVTEEQSRSLAYHEEYSGQLPYWRHVEQYDRIYPGAARIIFESFEKQGDHRREMEKTLLHGSERRASIGQFLGTAIIVVAVCGGIWLALRGQPVPGVSILTLALASGILSYVFGDGPKRKS